MAVQAARVASALTDEAPPKPSPQDVAADIDALLWAMRLHNIRRYLHHRFWEDETREALYADRVELGLKLESVSAHSWHVADTVLLLSDHFPQLDRGRCLELAVLHDKLEIITGDYNPVGRDGLGLKTHAFHAGAQLEKLHDERQAAHLYLQRLRPSARLLQARLIDESLRETSIDALFVKAVDKLQSFAFVHAKKDGVLQDRHIIFTLRYAAKCCKYFPGLTDHYSCLRDRFLNRIANRRGVLGEDLERALFGQLELDL